MEPNLFHTRYLCIGLFQTLREKETMAFSYIFVKFWIVWNNKNSFFMYEPMKHMGLWLY